MSARRILFGVLWAGSVVPLCFARYLPLVDLSRHATQVALWQAFAHDPVVRQHYTLHLTSPYAAFYFIWRAFLALGWSLPAAGRLATAVCILAMPPSFLWLLRERQRSLDWMLFLFALLYMDALAWGFLPFYLSLSALFCGLALFSRWLEQPTARRGAAVLVSGLFVMWCHALTVVLWGAACGLLAILAPLPWRRRWRALIPLVPVGVLLAIWTGAHAGSGAIIYRTNAITRLARVGGYLFRAFVTDSLILTRVGLIAAVILVGAGVVGRYRQRRADLSGEERTDLPLLAGGLFGLAMFLFMPDGISWTWHLNTRVLAPALLLVVASLAPPPWRVVRRTLAGLLILATVSLWVDVSHEFSAFDGDMGDAASLFAALPPKASVVRPEGTDAWDPRFGRPVLDHLADWAQADDLGPSTAFAHNLQALVLDSDDPWPRYDARIDRSDPNRWIVRRGKGRMPDYLIFMSRHAPPPSLPLADGGGEFRLFRQTGRLYAYQRSGARE